MPAFRNAAAALAVGLVACSPPPPSLTSPKARPSDSTTKAATRSRKTSQPPQEAHHAAPPLAQATSRRESDHAIEPGPEQPNSPEEAFCRGRAHCSVVGRVGQALLRDGFVHSVERIVLVAPEEVRHPPGDDARGDCSVEEFWFLKTDERGKLVDYQLITGGCTGEDADEIWCGRAPSVTVGVSGEEVSADWYSPFGQCWSAFSSAGRFTASLANFTTLSSRASTSHAFAGYTNAHSWNWKARTGSESFYFSAFSPDGAPLSGDECGDVEVETRVIPKFTTSPEFSSDSWKIADLAGCSTSFQTAVKSSREDKNATELHAFVGTSGTLFLQLDPVSAPSDSAFFEVCFGDEVLNDSNYCHYPVNEVCARVSIAGTVLHGSLVVEKAADAYRYAIDASKYERVRLMYRDPVRGAGIWSSPSGVAKRFSHSTLTSWETDKAECVVQDREAKILRRRPPRHEPVSTWGG